MSIQSGAGPYATTKWSKRILIDEIEQLLPLIREWCRRGDHCGVKVGWGVRPNSWIVDFYDDASRDGALLIAFDREFIQPLIAEVPA